MAFVYILHSRSFDRYYIGSTNSIEKRIEQHNNGEVKSTKAYCPWDLVLVQEYYTYREARAIEYRLKKLKRKDYIRKIISDGIIKLRLWLSG